MFNFRNIEQEYVIPDLLAGRSADTSGRRLDPGSAQYKQSVK